MTNITRWDPFREVYALRNMMDRMMDEGRWSERSQYDGGSSTYSLALDVCENEDEYTVKASVPGVDPDNLDISLNDNMLTIKGEMKDEREQDGNGQYHLRERRFGSFTRSISLPSSIAADEANADFENGILTLHLPKSPETKPRRISIGGGTKTIEPESSKSGDTSQKNKK
ncbi:MAG: Hsp20/alpha crystallin family protein [Caldilineaceae bacterium]